VNRKLQRVSSDLAFTKAVKVVQAKKGARAPTEFEHAISDVLAAFIAEPSNRVGSRRCAWSKGDSSAVTTSPSRFRWCCSE
jgi:hypothetical protein